MLESDKHTSLVFAKASVTKRTSFITLALDSNANNLFSLQSLMLEQNELAFAPWQELNLSLMFGSKDRHLTCATLG